MSDLITLQAKQLKAENLAMEVYRNMPSASFTNPSPDVPKRFYKLRSMAVRINKAINKIKDEERKNNIIPKKTIGELRAMVIEERRAIKEASFTRGLKTT